MKIEYKDHVEYSGQEWRGNLAVVDYREERRSHTRGLPLGGFGSMSHHDFAERAEVFVKLIHPDARVLLAIPFLIAEVSK